MGAAALGASWLLGAWFPRQHPARQTLCCPSPANSAAAGPRALLQPLEVLAPLIQNPGLAGGGRPLWVEALIKLKPLLMSVYFGADHIVWVQQVGAQPTPRSASVLQGRG